METKDNLYILFGELSKFANESAAVSDPDEKKDSIIAVLSALNRSVSSKSRKTMHFYAIHLQFPFIT